jgi:hypothetical protein
VTYGTFGFVDGSFFPAVDRVRRDFEADLAALISGDWTAAERQRMTCAYAAVEGLPPFSSRQLEFARLQLAVQWLGWAPPEWVAPEAQRHDWLANAIALAQGLDI